MSWGDLGWWPIAAAAWATIVVPIGVDGVVLARGHMRNPHWPAHAKLQCAMSFFAAVPLGAGALLLLWTRPATEILDMAVAAFLATAFWAGLLAAGAWPGSSYGFPDEPGIVPDSPCIAGVPLPVDAVTSVMLLILGWLGFWLIRYG